MLGNVQCAWGRNERVVAEACEGGDGARADVGGRTSVVVMVGKSARSARRGICRRIE